MREQPRFGGVVATLARHAFQFAYQRPFALGGQGLKWIMANGASRLARRVRNLQRLRDARRTVQAQRRRRACVKIFLRPDDDLVVFLVRPAVAHRGGTGLGAEEFWGGDIGGASERRKKHQTANIREAPNLKHQSHAFGSTSRSICRLEFGMSLELGAWSVELRPMHTHP